MIFQNETFLANEKQKQNFLAWQWHTKLTNLSAAQNFNAKRNTVGHTLGQISTCFWHKVNFNLWFRKLVRGFSERVNISFLLDRAGKKKMRKPILEVGYSIHTQTKQTLTQTWNLWSDQNSKFYRTWRLLNIQPKKLTAFSHTHKKIIDWNEKKIKT